MSEANGLPKGWAEATLGDACEISAGVGFPNDLQGKATGEYPFFKVGDISEAWQEGKKALVQARHYVSRDDLVALKARPLSEGSVVFAKIGAAISLNRRAVLGQPSLVDNNCMALWVPSTQLSPDYLFYFTCTLRLGELARASVVPSIRKSDLEVLPFPIAPLPEQHRIVEKIEELFSDLDAGVANLERAKANLKRYRASVLKSAVEGRLTEEWRKEYPQTEDGGMLLDRILRERREKWERDQLLKFKEKGKEPPKNWQSKYKEPLQPDASELSDLPLGWAWATTEQICVQVTDGEHNQPRYQETGIPMLTATHVRNGGVSFEKAGLIAEADYEKARARCAPMTGDVLIVCVGATTGRAGLVGEEHLFALVRSVLLLKPIVAGRYLLLWIDSPWTQAWIRTASGASAQAHFYISDAKRMPIPLPPLAEQEQIVALVEERLSQIDSAEKTIDAELIRSKRLRQSILKRAFEGKLVPQDPKDEPASVLLERIKATRERQQPNKKSKRVKAK